MQAADGKNLVDLPEGLSVPHDTRQERAALGRTGPVASSTPQQADRGDPEDVDRAGKRSRGGIREACLHCHERGGEIGPHAPSRRGKLSSPRRLVGCGQADDRQAASLDDSQVDRGITGIGHGCGSQEHPHLMPGASSNRAVFAPAFSFSTTPRTPYSSITRRSTSRSSCLVSFGKAGGILSSRPVSGTDHRQAGSRMARAGRGEDALHRAGIAMGERLRGELQWQTARRAAGPGSL